MSDTAIKEKEEAGAVDVAIKDGKDEAPLSATPPPVVQRCLNCGESLLPGSAFCHKCGQSASVGRITMKSFVKKSLSDVTRINKGALYTCMHLLWHPWRVISDYLNGKRVTYTAPMPLLIIISFLIASIALLTGMSFFDVSSLTIGGEGTPLNRVVSFFLSSPVFSYFMLTIPLIPVMFMLQRRNGKAKYNAAECLVALLYMSDSILLCRLLFTPLELLTSKSFSIYYMSYVFVLSLIGLFLSFKRLGLSHTRAIGRIALFAVLSITSYFLFLLSLIIPIAFYLYLHK